MFKFWHLSVFAWARIWGSVVTFHSLKGCATKKVWEILIYVIVLGLLYSWRWDWWVVPKCQHRSTILWCVQSQKRAGPYGQSACQSLKLGYCENMLQINKLFCTCSVKFVLTVITITNICNSFSHGQLCLFPRLCGKGEGMGRWTGEFHRGLQVLWNSCKFRQLSDSKRVGTWCSASVSDWRIQYVTWTTCNF